VVAVKLKGQSGKYDSILDI